MAKINILDKHTAELIAAGEVVERPASAIKELIENSIDAGATAITVEIKAGSSTFMRITDNGRGIEPDDIRNAFLRHATSKIKNPSDLDSIWTLGFRGEALASICAVSKIEVLTRTAGSDFGVRYVIHGGDEICYEEAGCAEGTTIVVRDLFYNTPARMKFLKKDNTESNLVVSVIERIAVSHPEISFKLIRDGRQIINTPGDGKLYSAIFTVFGRDFAQGLISVDYEMNGVKVQGYVSKPTESRKSRGMQFFFMNGRFIRTKTGIAALEQAYKNSIMVGTFPGCVLTLSIDASKVDVNVHPAKIEVRFSDDNAIFQSIYYAVKSALNADTTRVQFETRENVAKHSVPDTSQQLNFVMPDPHKSSVQSTGAKPFYINMSAEQFRSQNKEKPQTAPAGADYNHTTEKDIKARLAEPEAAAYNADSGKAVISHITPHIVNVVPDNAAKSEADSSTVPEQAEATFNSNIKKVSADAQIDAEPLPVEPENNTAGHIDFKYVGEAFATYIIVESGGKLILIDKHAAHERILFERIRRSAKHIPQMLLSPIKLNLSANEYDAVVSHIDDINALGFEIEEYGLKTVLIRGVPMELDGEDAKSLIVEISGRLCDKFTDFNPEFLDWLYHSVACRAAIKAGNKSTAMELEALADTVLNDPEIRYCPHGRPVAAELGKNEILKRFLRI